jgi:hypothetical protein
MLLWNAEINSMVGSQYCCSEGNASKALSKLHLQSKNLECTFHVLDVQGFCRILFLSIWIFKLSVRPTAPSYPAAAQQGNNCNWQDIPHLPHHPQYLGCKLEEDPFQCQCRTLCTIAACIVNIKNELKSMALRGCRKKLWPGTVNDLQGFTNQQAKIRHSFILACKVPGERFPDFEEAHIEKVLDTHAAEIIEEELDKSWQYSVNQFRTIWESLC